MTRIYGYLYDFWVYVVGQTEKAQGITDENLFHYGKLTCKKHKYSGPNSFAFPICDSPGMYYNVFSSYEEHGGTIFIKEIIKEKKHYFCVPWRNGEEINDVRWVTIDSEYREDITDLLHFLVDRSPVKKVYVQIRCQGLEKDNITGMMTVNQFVKIMNNDELLGNMVYVIREPCV